MLVSLCDLANPSDFTAYPSLAYLTEACGIARRTVLAHLAALEKKDLIDRMPRAHRSSLYTVRVSDEFKLRAAREVAKHAGKPAGGAESAPGAENDGGGGKSRTSGVQKTARGGAESAPRTIKDPPQDPSREQIAPRDGAPPPAAPADQFFISIPVRDAPEGFAVTELVVAHLEELYAGIDVRQCLRNICGHWESRPQQQKTHAGMLKSIHHWLAKDQNEVSWNRKVPRRGGADAPPDQSREPIAKETPPCSTCTRPVVRRLHHNGAHFVHMDDESAECLSPEMHGVAWARKTWEQVFPDSPYVEQPGATP